MHVLDRPVLLVYHENISTTPNSLLFCDYAVNTGCRRRFSKHTINHYFSITSRRTSPDPVLLDWTMKITAVPTSMQLMLSSCRKTERRRRRMGE